MKQSSLKRDLWLDRLFLALSLLGIGIFAYLLNDHSILFRSKQKSERQKIGSVEQSQYDVRRRESNEYVWIPLGDLESVYLGDLLPDPRAPFPFNSNRELSFGLIRILWLF